MYKAINFLNVTWGGKLEKYEHIGNHPKYLHNYVIITLVLFSRLHIYDNLLGVIDHNWSDKL